MVRLEKGSQANGVFNLLYLTLKETILFLPSIKQWIFLLMVLKLYSGISIVPISNNG